MSLPAIPSIQQQLGCLNVSHIFHAYPKLKVLFFYDERPYRDGFISFSHILAYVAHFSIDMGFRKSEKCYANVINQ